MDQALKGDAGQCQETTKVQGKKNWSSLLLQHPWTRKGSLDHIEYDSEQDDHGALPPSFSAYGQNPAGVTCHFTQRGNS